MSGSIFCPIYIQVLTAEILKTVVGDNPVDQQKTFNPEMLARAMVRSPLMMGSRN